MKYRTKLARALGAMLLAAVVLTGGSARAATRIEIAYLPILPMSQLFVIDGEGWGKEVGLEFHLTKFTSGPAMVQALASGNFDVAYVGIGPVMVARANGIALKAVAANGIEQVALLGRGALVEDFAKAKSPAEAFAAFRQRSGHAAKIATLPKGSVPDTVLRHWLDEVIHLAPDAVEILGVGEDRVQQLLLSGAVDAGSILEPILTLVQERDKSAHILETGGAMFPDQPGAVLAMREAFIAAHPDAALALVALHIRATELLRKDPDQVAPLVQNGIGKGLIALDTVKAALKSPAMNAVADPHVIVAATRDMADYQMKLGVLSKPVVIGELFDTSFYDRAVGHMPGQN